GSCRLLRISTRAVCSCRHGSSDSRGAARLRPEPRVVPVGLLFQAERAAALRVLESAFHRLAADLAVEHPQVRDLEPHGMPELDPAQRDRRAKRRHAPELPAIARPCPRELHEDDALEQAFAYDTAPCPAQRIVARRTAGDVGAGANRQQDDRHHSLLPSVLHWPKAMSCPVGTIPGGAAKFPRFAPGITAPWSESGRHDRETNRWRAPLGGGLPARRSPLRAPRGPRRDLAGLDPADL